MPARRISVEKCIIRSLKPANTTTKRTGYLLINPGGPGASTVSNIRSIASCDDQLSPELFNSFDFFGVDSRGVGMSSPVRCDPAIFNERVSLFPKSKEEYDRLVDKNKRLGESCLKRTSNIVNHLDTISAAKDLEAVRAALGEDEKMNWLGLSYGTQLGAQYARLFPDNVPTMVLDGMLQHSLSEAAKILIETTACATGLQSFFQWVKTSDEFNPLKEQDPEKLWNNLIKKATEAPIPVLGCDACYQEVTADKILLNAQRLITSNIKGFRGFDFLAGALLNASNGDAQRFVSTKLRLEEDAATVFSILLLTQVSQ